MNRIHDVVAVEVIGPHALRVTFDDGHVREVDLEGQLEGPVFEPLRDPELFARAKVDSELGTVYGRRAPTSTRSCSTRACRR